MLEMGIQAGSSGIAPVNNATLNPNTGDDFAMFVKECILPDRSKRPFSVWFSGAYPLEFNGLTRSLSLDMRVIDPAWVGKKTAYLVAAVGGGGVIR